MTTLTIIAVALTLAYNLAATVGNKGILPSLSDSFYVFGGAQKAGYVFYGYLVAMFGLLIAPILGVSPENWKFLGFLALGALCFVGAAADFALYDMEHKVHVYAALGTASLSLLWCSVVGHLDTALWSMGVAVVIAYINPKSKVYWLEMGCFASVFITLFCLLT